jgi:hypothetical protein
VAHKHLYPLAEGYSNPSHLINEEQRISVCDCTAPVRWTHTVNSLTEHTARNFQGLNLLKQGTTGAHHCTICHQAAYLCLNQASAQTESLSERQILAICMACGRDRSATYGHITHLLWKALFPCLYLCLKHSGRSKCIHRSSREKLALLVWTYVQYCTFVHTLARDVRLMVSRS